MPGPWEQYQSPAGPWQRYENNSGVMPQINRGITDSLGGLVDFINPFDQPHSLNPFPEGTGSAVTGLQNAMDFIGSPVAQGEPQTYGEHAARGVGDAASFLLPVGVVAKVLQRGGTLAAKLGSGIMQPFTSAPVRATAAELAAGGVGFPAGEFAERAAGPENNPLHRLAGELTGGLAAAVGPGAALRGVLKLGNALPATGHAIRSAKAAYLPFTEAGGRIKASERLRSLVANPDQVSQSLRQPDIGNLTPSQKTGEQGIIELENYLASVDPVFRDGLARQTQQSRATLVGETRHGLGGASVENARDFIARRREAFRVQLTASVDQAKRTADEAVRNVAPQMRETASSVIVRQEIDKAYSSARLQERALWDAVPSQATVDTSSLKDVFAQIIQNTPRAQSGDIPGEAIRLIDEFQGAETVREMHGLYSKLRQTAREAGSGVAPNANKARLANDLAKAILKDLGAIDGTTHVGQAINEARAFSRVMNETFNQGTVGRITGATRNAGDAVSPETALSVSLGRGGAGGAVSVDDIRRAAPGADTGIEDFLKSRFTDRAAPRGQFSPNRGDDFMRVNREVMDRYPTLAEQFSEASGAGRRLERTQTRIGDTLRRIDDPRQSVGAAFTGANRGSEIATSVFKARNPMAAIQELRRQAAKDPTGQALDGLKDGFIDYVMDAASKGLDAQGIQNVVGDRLSGNLTRDTGIFEQIFSPDEMKRLRRIADEFKAINFSESGRSADALISDVPSSVLDFVGRTLAARQGAKLGGGISGASLVTANAATRKMRGFLENLTANKASLLLQKAIKDADVMADLLLEITPQNADRIERRLVEWLTGVTALQVSNQHEEGQRGRLSDRLSGGLPNAGYNRAPLGTLARTLQQNRPR